MALWIDYDDAETIQGEIGFLVRTQDQNVSGSPETYHISLRPAHTNQSREPRLRGWCGTTQGQATFAEGLAKVVRVTKNDRAMVARVPQSEEAAALEELGYPELAEVAS